MPETEKGWCEMIVQFFSTGIPSRTVTWMMWAGRNVSDKA